MSNLVKTKRIPAKPATQSERAEDILHIGDECRGVYLPQFIATEWLRPHLDAGACVQLSEDMVSILEAGPDHEEYWDTWDKVAFYGDTLLTHRGRQYAIIQDGGVYLLAVDASAESMARFYGE